MTDRLARMKELEAKATQGPWHVSTLGEACYGDPNDMRESFSVRDTTEDNEPFIVELRNAAKDLIELVEEARPLIEGAYGDRYGREWLSKLSEFQNEGVKRE